MALTSSCLLLALCGFGVQGSNLDLASTLQKHMDSHAEAPWKARAQGFIGLLQSMGKQVPEEKQAATRTMVEEIIKLLTDTRSGLKETESGRVTKIEGEITELIRRVKEYDGLAKTSKILAVKKDGELATCYKQLRVQESKYQGQCHHAGSLLEHTAEIKPIESCERADAMKKMKFDVSKQFTWQCNFTDGDTVESCTNSESDLFKDLDEKKKLIQAKALEYYDLRQQCIDDTEIHITLCNDTSTNVTEKTTECANLLSTASEALCSFTSHIHTREEWLIELKEKRIAASSETWWGSELQQWDDLNLIVCVFKRFKNAMNFASDDFSECQKDTAGRPFVTKPEVPELPDLLSIENITFGGGLADKYLRQPHDLTGQFDTPSEEKTRKVTVDIHLVPPAKSQLFLKLADATDAVGRSCEDPAKTEKSWVNLEAAKTECVAEKAECKFLEFAPAANSLSYLGGVDCVPQVETSIDSVNHYTILRKMVCSSD